MIQKYYRKSPVEAIQYTLESRDDVIRWAQGSLVHSSINEDGEVYELLNLRLITKTGFNLPVSVGCWVVRGPEGFWPVEDDIFQQVYSINN